MKKKQEVQISGRCWGMIVVLLVVISFIVSNGMNTKGYNSTERKIHLRIPVMIILMFRL